MLLMSETLRRFETKSPAEIAHFHGQHLLSVKENGQPTLANQPLDLFYIAGIPTQLDCAVGRFNESPNLTYVAFQLFQPDPERLGDAVIILNPLLLGVKVNHRIRSLTRFGHDSFTASQGTTNLQRFYAQPTEEISFVAQGFHSKVQIEFTWIPPGG